MGTPVAAIYMKMGRSPNCPAGDLISLSVSLSLVAPTPPSYQARQDCRFYRTLSQSDLLFSTFRNYRRPILKSISASVGDRIQAPTNVSSKWLHRIDARDSARLKRPKGLRTNQNPPLRGKGRHFKARRSKAGRLLIRRPVDSSVRRLS